MEYYLSSYKIGGEKEVNELKKLLPENRKTAFISNALDFSVDFERRKESERNDIAQLTEAGLIVEPLNLKDYFGKPEKLEEDLNKFGVIWIRGGNTFVLRQAMKLSGMDNILKKFAKENKNILYGGYSAGAVILAPDLKGVELVDDPNQHPYPQEQKTLWDGLGLIDYAIVPHYKSNHPESPLVDAVVEKYEKEKVPFKTLRDGEVIIIKDKNKV